MADFTTTEMEMEVTNNTVVNNTEFDNNYDLTTVDTPSKTDTALAAGVVAAGIGLVVGAVALGKKYIVPAVKDEFQVQKLAAEKRKEIREQRKETRRLEKEAKKLAKAQVIETDENPTELTEDTEE